MSPQPGEIWLADLGLAAKTRPVVIVSRQDPDPPRSLVLYVPLTTQRRDSPYEVPLPRLSLLDRESVAMFKDWALSQSSVWNASSARSPRRARANWARRHSSPPKSIVTTIFNFRRPEISHLPTHLAGTPFRRANFSCEKNLLAGRAQVYPGPRSDQSSRDTIG